MAVRVTLTPESHKIIEFIRHNAVFLGKAGKHHAKGRITAQEAFALVNRARPAGLTLDLVQRYFPVITDLIPSSWFKREIISAWYLETTLGYFCDNFPVIKKRFDSLEDGIKDYTYTKSDLYSLLVNTERAACDFIHLTRFRVPYCENAAGAYRALMVLDPTADDDGMTSAAMVFHALALPNILPADREFIIARHRCLAQEWFLRHPQVCLGLEDIGFAVISLAIGPQWRATISKVSNTEFSQCLTTASICAYEWGRTKAASPLG